VSGQRQRERTVNFRTSLGLARAFRRWASDSEVSLLPGVVGATLEERRLLGALGGMAAAIGGEHAARWPEPISQWATSASVPPGPLVEGVLEELGHGADPLSRLYDVCISPTGRRRLGTVFTPQSVVEHMLSLADRQFRGKPACVMIGRDIHQHEQTLRDLEAQQAHLVELSYKGLVSDQILARKQKEIEAEQARVNDLLAKAQQHAEDLESQLAAILEHTKSPYATYKVGTPLERRILNQLFFKQIFMDRTTRSWGPR